MVITTPKDLFINTLSDVYSAEMQIIKVLPKLAQAAHDDKLISVFQTHLAETQGQVERLDQLVETITNVHIKRIKCHAMEGLMEEIHELISSVNKGPLLDAGLIGAAQKVEHYEIATYGTLAALAKKLGFKKAAELLLATLQEEKTTDEKLTKIAQFLPGIQPY